MLKEELTGLVIAGGKSSRMGVEKGLVQFGGKPLIIYPVELLKQVCSSVIISANSNAFDFLKLPVTMDITPGSGPMAGIYSGLTTASTENIFVLSCDMPLMNIGLLQYLISSSEGAKTIVVWHKGYAEPLCGIYHRDLIGELEGHIAEEKFKLISFLEKVNARYIHINESMPFYNPDLFLNVNTPRDLMRGEAFLVKN
jgi:molybdenum cofactor guanylyltransferase